MDVGAEGEPGAVVPGPKYYIMLEMFLYRTGRPDSGPALYTRCTVTVVA
jgi:hypothetical protein